MNATRAELKRQYDRAKRLAWTEHFREASNTITAGFFDTADLMAIGSRETNLDPKWLTKKGDNGHGAGLMQIDDRSFPAFTNSDKWKDARLGIIYGAQVLMQKWNDVQKNAGKRLIAKDRKGRSYTFTGPHVSGITAQQIAIAGYNSGRWAAYHYSKSGNPDAGTTGKDYSADVMARARVFREYLGKDGLLDHPSSMGVAQKVSPEPAETAGATETTQETSQSIKLTENDQPSGEVTVKTETKTSTGIQTAEVTTTQNVVIEKKEGWFRRKWKEIVGFATGNSLLDGFSEKLAQVQALGLPTRFWTNLVYFTIGGAVIYLAFDWYRDYQDRKLTHSLIDANSTPTNMVQTSSAQNLEAYDQDPNWQVIRK